MIPRLALLLLSAAGAIQDAPPPAVTLTVGISGGKIPPRVRLRIEIFPGADKARVRVLRLVPQKSGKDVEDLREGDMSNEDYAKLIEALEPIWTLPLEKPAGGSDIYRLDTSIRLVRDKKTWENRAPGGCIHHLSEVQPSDEQRATFARLVDRVKAAGDQHAPAPK